MVNQIYSSIVFIYQFEVLVCYLSISILFDFILRYITEANSVLFIPQHLSDSLDYLFTFQIIIFYALLLQWKQYISKCDQTEWISVPFWVGENVLNS